MENYFSFYDLEPCFILDEKQLKTAFLKNSRKYHPDYYTQSSDAEKRFALDMTTKNNTAYKVLLDPVKRIEHILKIHKILGDASSEEKMDNMFLMEMMEVNEQIMDAKLDQDDNSLENIRQEIGSKTESLEKKAHLQMKEFDKSQDLSLLPEIKAYYFKKKYIARILQQISGEEVDLEF